MLTLIYRNILALRHNILHLIMADIVDNLIWLSIFAFGFATFMPDVNGYSYQEFVVAGYILIAGYYQLAMEGTHRFYGKLEYSKWWTSLICTPLSLRRLLWSELSWVVVRSLMSTAVICAVVVPLGLIRNVDALILSIPMVIFGCYAFAALTLLFTSFVKSDALYVYYWTLIFSPMWLVTGALYDKSQVPEFLQYAAYFYPATYVIEPLQALILEGSIPFMEYLEVCVLMAVITFALMFIAEKQFKRRLYS